MTQLLPAEQLWDQGLHALVSVIPPGAQLTPSSKIHQNQLGKVPGRRLPNGLWAGYDWRRHTPTREEVRGWSLAGASLGVLAKHYPAIDIDCSDEELAGVLEQVAVAVLGDAPQRIGRYPKRLLMYRLEGEPFGRMRLWITYKAQHHLVEVLGDGQQYLVHGIHPGTMLPYRWDCELEQLNEQLPTLAKADAEKFLDELALHVMSFGAVVEREGDGRTPGQAAADQAGLVAPSLELLREAVECIPNDNDAFPTRQDYLRVGYAIRAAAGEAIDEGQALFSAWAAKWKGNDRAPGNDPEVVLADWRRMKGPYAVGWGWIAEQARGYGFQDAALDFDAPGVAPAPADREDAAGAPAYSDQWLADKIVEAKRGELRYVPQTGNFLVWNGARWQVDHDLLAEDVINQQLRRIAVEVLRTGATEREKKESRARATAMCSAGKAASVATILKSKRAIAVGQELLDSDNWVLNTPNGLVNLKTGELSPPDPDALCTRSTEVPVDRGAGCPRWQQFLLEATRNDADLVAYLQRLCGFALTGSVREQQLTFIWGPGGSGKGTFLNVVRGILGDYARQADMNTFTASNTDRHTTELAFLQGARLVTASETQAGKRWDEQRVKALTGADPITARFMRQDNFTFLPQFKLLFIGNHKPELRDVDDAMKRRMHLVPFDKKPSVVDTELDVKLRAEWPAILAWMIDGCVAWQAVGLAAPERVRVATKEYLADEDAVGRWLQEETQPAEGQTVFSSDLFNRWREWANANGEYPGKTKGLVQALNTRGLERWRDPETRRMGFVGIKLKDRQDLGITA